MLGNILNRRKHMVRNRIRRPGKPMPGIQLQWRSDRPRLDKFLSNHKCQGKLRAVPGTRPPLFRVEDLDAWLNGGSRA